MGIDWTDEELFWACNNSYEAGTVTAIAFDALRRELYPISLFMCIQAELTGPEQIAEDCTQDALVRIWQKAHTCQQPERYRAWCKSVLRNTTLNAISREWRRTRRTTPLPQEETSTQPVPAAPEPVGESVPAYEQLLDFLRSAPLSDRSRSVIVGKYLLEQKDAEMAAHLSQREGKSVQTNHVQTTRSKNLDKLRSNPEIVATLRAL